MVVSSDFCCEIYLNFVADRTHAKRNELRYYEQDFLQ